MEFSDNQAIYVQIANNMLENILQHKWKESERIPSVREIAVDMQVNPNTAMRTFGYLQDRGIIFNNRGIGYFVSEDGISKTQELKKEEFLNKSVPEFFKTAKLLGISQGDIISFYKQY
jgi:GntR family transcriptional regulator